MLITILIIYTIAAIVAGIVGFLFLTDDGNSFECSLICSIIGALIIPPIGLVLLIIYLLPIIIPCATAIYLFG